MSGLTAEIVEQKREADRASVQQRHGLRHTVRDARERLTSSTGLNRIHDYELVRLFAQSKMSAAIAMAVSAIGITLGLLVWVPPALAIAWCVIVLMTTGAGYALTQKFLALPQERANPITWRRHFMFMEFAAGVSWALLVGVSIADPSETLRIFMLIALLVIASVNAMLAAAIRAVVLASLVPTFIGALVLVWGMDPMASTVLTVVTVGAILFYWFMTARAHESARLTIGFRADKDRLLVDLAEANARHDEARRRAEEANIAKSSFLATMSHELRTPLNAILGFSEVMKSELFGPHSVPQYREYATDIHASGQHLLNIINEILDLSRIEAGRYDLQEEAVDLSGAVDECRHMLELRARNKSITIKAVIEPQLPRLWGDERAIRQITLNLIANAIKFTPPGGEVTVKVGWTAQGGQYVSIKDTGPGIPEDEIPIVLSSFGRGTLAIKTAEQGTGLGLPIVKGLVDLHGGQFHLRSKLREGTEAIVTFPAERVMDTLAAVASDQAA
jgi:two-component system cell cycle sensor histidine kinase PleC